MPEEELAVGSLLGDRYQIHTLLGRGGMGLVYKAFDTLLKMPVALKIINPAIAGDEEVIRRLKQEVVLSRKFTHPNACRIYDIGTGNGRLYVSMEYIDGKTLEQVLLQKGRLSLQEVIVILRDVLQALAEAHQAGVVHRDLKPQNIMISGNKAYLMDFGISFSQSLDRLTRTGVVVGTPFYMSPEQFLGEPVDQRSDIYSLGMILFEMATGKLPFRANTPASVMYFHMNETPPAPSLLISGLPVEFDRIVMKALQKKPGDRYANVNDLLAALVHLYAQETRSQIDRDLEKTRTLVTRDTTPAEDGGSIAVSPAGKPIAVSQTVRSRPEPEPARKKRHLVVAVLAFCAPLVFAVIDLIWITPLSARLRLTTVPPGATVQLDDRQWPQKTPTVIRIPRTGRHALRLDMDGYQEYTETIDASPAKNVLHGMHRDIHLILIPFSTKASTAITKAPPAVPSVAPSKPLLEKESPLSNPALANPSVPAPKDPHISLITTPGLEAALDATAAGFPPSDIAFRLIADAFMTSKGDAFATLAVSTPTEIAGGHVGIRVVNSSGNAVKEWEMPLATPGEVPRYFQASLPLSPGEYRVSLAVVSENKAGGTQQELIVPDLAVAFCISSLILARDTAQGRGFDLLPAARPEKEPYTFGKVKLHPSVDHIFSQTDTLIIAYEIYNPTVGSAAQKPDLEAIFTFQGDGLNPISTPSRSPEGFLTDRKMTVVTSFPLESFAPGSYLLTVALTDRISNRSASQTSRFQVESGFDTSKQQVQAADKFPALKDCKLLAITERDGNRTAILAGPDNKARFLKVGDRIYDGRITSIERDRIIVTQTFSDGSKKEIAKKVERQNP